VVAGVRIGLFYRYAVALPSPRRDNTGDAAATALTDTEKLEFFYAHTVAQLFAAAVVCLAGLTLLTVAYPPLALVALACLAVVGAAEGPQLTALFAIRHRRAPGHLRARVFTTGASLKISAFAAGAALAGPLAQGSLPVCLGTAAALHLAAALVPHR
jgi:ABC-type transport system involved in cytochrome bd biosynthesis fused ATPase/permease subunit